MELIERDNLYLFYENEEILDLEKIHKTQLEGDVKKAQLLMKEFLSGGIMADAVDEEHYDADLEDIACRLKIVGMLSDKDVMVLALDKHDLAPETLQRYSKELEICSLNYELHEEEFLNSRHIVLEKLTTV